MSDKCTLKWQEMQHAPTQLLLIDSVEHCLTKQLITVVHASRVVRLTSTDCIREQDEEISAAHSALTMTQQPKWNTTQSNTQQSQPVGKHSSNKQCSHGSQILWQQPTFLSEGGL